MRSLTSSCDPELREVTDWDKFREEQEAGPMEVNSDESSMNEWSFVARGNGVFSGSLVVVSSLC